MSASHPQAGQLPRGGSLLSNRLKEAGRALLAPLVRLAQRLGITPNGVTVIGFVVVAVAAGLVAIGQLLAGAIILVAGSLLDAVDGALARATGGSTPFGGFLDSTLDRAAEAILYVGIIIYFLRSSTPTRSDRWSWRSAPCAARSWSATREPRPRRSASRPRSGSLHAPSGSSWSWPASRWPGSGFGLGSSAPSASSPPWRRQPPSSASGTFNAR